MFDENLSTENIRIGFAPAASDTLVVSFAHMGYPVMSPQFWGQNALAKAGFAAVGLACRTDCWFPAGDMARLAEQILRFAESYRKIVLYGFSMGAYGAVKYSRALRAAVTIALSPQYSIDPKDVFAVDRRLVRHFNPALNPDMAIKSGDLSGDIFLFRDPFLALDVWNCDRIIARSPGEAAFHAINLPRIGHETIDLFAGSEKIGALIRMCGLGDAGAVARYACLERRRAKRRTLNALLRLREKRPACAQALYQAHAPSLPQHLRDAWPGAKAGAPSA